MQAVWDAFSKGFIFRHGVCRVRLTDHKAEFTALDFEPYLSQIGIEYRMSTPAHPQSNGKIEIFNRTFKQMIQKVVNDLTISPGDSLMIKSEERLTLTARWNHRWAITL